MVNLEILEQMFVDNQILSTAEHKNIIDKIEHIEERFSEKIDSLEESSKEFQTYKNYGIGIFSLITFIAAIYVFFV